MFEPGQGEVRIAVSVSGLSPGDVKKRSGWQGSPMAYPRVIPHSDGAGTIDAVGDSVDQARVGERVWCYGAQSYRPFGTAAEFVVVPSELASDAAGRRQRGREPRTGPSRPHALGSRESPAYRAVLRRWVGQRPDGARPRGGRWVGSIATQMAVRDGATVIAVVRSGPAAARRGTWRSPRFCRR